MSKCEHGKRKAQCIECGGTSICEHRKRRSTCKECGGTSICEHMKQKKSCKECGFGYVLCKHLKTKAQCKECGGSAFCQHGKYKSHCRECGGSVFCQHGKEKNYCKECGGISICEHGKRKAQCIDCGGTSICEHRKRRSTCKECGGTSICEHGKQKTICIECGGSQMCIHNKKKKFCRLCDGSKLCKSTWCETTGNSKYEYYCLACFVNNPENQNKPIIHNYKTKEKEVVNRIRETFTHFTWVADKKVQDGCSRRRPDLLLDMGSHIIIIEVDENKHTDYDCSCEHKRLMELSHDLHHRPIIFIRFNPDDYTNQEGKLIKSCWKLNKLGIMNIMKSKENEWEERINILKQQINYWINNPTEKTIEIIELFY